ncbi:nephrin-like, partial [Penaeus japonicus]|uniref:nephrin-like n=1 Tax=Penaeus japonicus TaxID=27405 RepID=UPI001C7152B7
MGRHSLVELIILILASTEIRVTGAAIKPDQVKEVWVVVGERAELPCAPSPKLSLDKPVLVLWYRSSDTLPVYSYDARAGEFSSGSRWADESALGGRADFNVLSETPTLVLEPAQPRDEGVYTCRVDYRLSVSTKTIVNLTVVIPPGPPMIMWGGRGVVGTIGPLSEDEQVELSCRSEGGRPQPALTWWLRGHRVELLDVHSTSDNATDTYWVEGHITVTASRDLQGAALSCHVHTPTKPHAQHPAINQTQTASIMLNITLPPLAVRIVGSDQHVAAGRPLRLECQALGSFPPAQLSWWRGHSRLRQVIHEVEGGGNVTKATLTLMIDRSFHGVTLSCRGSNPALPSIPPLVDSLKLNVN